MFLDVYVLLEIVPRVSTRSQISMLIVNFSEKNVVKFWRQILRLLLLGKGRQEILPPLKFTTYFNLEIFTCHHHKLLGPLLHKMSLANLAPLCPSIALAQEGTCGREPWGYAFNAQNWKNLDHSGEDGLVAKRSLFLLNSRHICDFSIEKKGDSVLNFGSFEIL